MELNEIGKITFLSDRRLSRILLEELQRLCIFSFRPKLVVSPGDMNHITYCFRRLV
jgi:hypothetical protein